MASLRQPHPGHDGRPPRQPNLRAVDCASALRALVRGGYKRERVFFADAPTAIAAGYRPCAVCLPAQYVRWKQRQTRDTSATASGG